MEGLRLDGALPRLPGTGRGKVSYSPAWFLGNLVDLWLPTDDRGDADGQHLSAASQLGPAGAFSAGTKGHRDPRGTARWLG